jgi:membrane protease YdiL (CAAX protease family)
MRSGRDIPGRGEAGDADQPQPPTFRAEAIRPALIGIGATVVCAWVVEAAVRLVWVPPALFVLLYYLVIFGGLARTALLASTRWGSDSFPVDFGWWARRTDALRAVVLAWLAALAGGIAVAPFGDSWTTNGDWVASADGATVVVFAAFAIVAAPLFEELVFRGLLLRALTSRYGARPAILIQGVVFGLYHLNFHGGGSNLPNIVYITVWGTVMGVAAHRYRRLGPTMAAHALTNLLVTLAHIAS